MFPGIEDSTRLIHNLSESYSVEVKSWFDPMSADGKIKLIKAMIALRNNDGGRLVIGFDDATMAAVQEGRPESVRTTFGQDAVQALVTRYSSEAFEVQVQYVENGGADHPVICVPAGVRTPVATKGEVKDPDTQRVILPINTVYVRTLQSNNTVSTAAARWQDWDRICGLCFDNREACCITSTGRIICEHRNADRPGCFRTVSPMARYWTGCVQREVSCALDNGAEGRVLRVGSGHHRRVEERTCFESIDA
jgi:hypothetical protein